MVKISGLASVRRGSREPAVGTDGQDPLPRYTPSWLHLSRMWRVCVPGAYIGAAHRRIRNVPGITFDKPILFPLFVGVFALAGAQVLNHFVAGY
jgi:hypothetical protein